MSRLKKDDRSMPKRGPGMTRIDLPRKSILLRPENTIPSFNQLKQTSSARFITEIKAELNGFDDKIQQTESRLQDALEEYNDAVNDALDLLEEALERKVSSD